MRTEFRRWTRFWQKNKQIPKNMRQYYKTSRENPYRYPNEILQSRSETWVTTKRDVTRLEAAEMRFQ
jgi:hypothetical protein